MHVIETYPFERDQLIELPSELGGHEAFQSPARLSYLIKAWQSDIPIRVLEEDSGWQRASVFYARVGTEDSLGSSLPPGAIALVEPIGELEQQRPNPKAIYLLQFGNGYRCSRCVVTKGKLLLLASPRSIAVRCRSPIQARCASWGECGCSPLNCQHPSKGRCSLFRSHVSGSTHPTVGASIS